MLAILKSILEALGNLPSPRPAIRAPRPGSFADKLDSTRKQRFN
jgi:hypothetical protein